MINTGCRLALRAAGVIERRLSVVLFHRVLSAPDPILVNEPDIERFEEQVRWLRDSFVILRLREAAERLFAGTLPAGALCITFDDGYRDNAVNALPVLEALGVPATFFVTTRYIDGGMMWNDRVVEAVRAWPQVEIDLSAHGLAPQSLTLGRTAAMDKLLAHLKYLPYAAREALADDLLAQSGAQTTPMMMNAADIQRLYAAGMEIGGHTVSHPILSKLPKAEARREIADNKTLLEDIVGAPLASFAYPNGRPWQDYDGRHVGFLRECGYRYAATTSPGTATAYTSPMQLPRFTPWDRSRAKYMARMLGNYFRRPECVPEAA